VKLGFSLPPDLEARLVPYIPWGSKQRVIEGLLRVLIGQLEQKDYTLWTELNTAYHSSRSPRPTSAPESKSVEELLRLYATSKGEARKKSPSTASAKAGRSKQ